MCVCINVCFQAEIRQHAEAKETKKNDPQSPRTSSAPNSPTPDNNGAEGDSSESDPSLSASLSRSTSNSSGMSFSTESELKRHSIDVPITKSDDVPIKTGWLTKQGSVRKVCYW